MSDARRAGDADPSKAIIADTMKLVSSYSFWDHRGGEYFSMQKTDINPAFLGGKFIVW